ncbi:cytochrome c-type biogenesis protein [Stenotrophomonas sp. C3(2023)]|uniref:cytochrome c-type biogenesis protein n=1 Tax=Stenotrophomonas sp. C3(2023) TaxID=3080277 RepID=UPI00293C4456|nr:cytochrome c-type biogenesis protein [Stenotrophomonas sp. C3(2023)]MDV3468498.1 cytochrome c-type biogenesis protein [Stenotrophomonas sp. C3(2023)]
MPPPRAEPPPVRRIASAALLALWLIAGAVSAAPGQPLHDARPLRFASAAEEARFHALAAQLRCVQCQNQSLADSNAQIAQDLRREVLHLIQQGHDDDWIKQFLVQRYGEFVLYQPPLQPSTWLLWGGPVVFLAAGALVLGWQVRRRSHGLEPIDDQTVDGDLPR